MITRINGYLIYVGITAQWSRDPWIQQFYMDRSSVACTGVDSKELHCRRREAIFHRTNVLDGHIIPLLQQAGFYGVARLGFISLDWHLITAFVER